MVYYKNDSEGRRMIDFNSTIKLESDGTIIMESDSRIEDREHQSHSYSSNGDWRVLQWSIHISCT